MDEPLPERIGRYRVLGELGGAMGVVYRAEDPMLNRTVAIKTILLSFDPALRAEYEARFRQEAKAAGGLNHPNLITIYDVGREGDMAYMAMELLEGVELRDMMKSGRLELPFVLEILAQVADGLAFAHERGVVHRDVKPGNIMIVGGRRAKVMDFGVARMRASDIETQVGAVLGSPKYMSPEQVAGTRSTAVGHLFPRRPSCTSWRPARRRSPRRHRAVHAADRGRDPGAAERSEPRAAADARPDRRAGAGEGSGPALPERGRLRGRPARLPGTARTGGAGRTGAGLRARGHRRLGAGPGSIAPVAPIRLKRRARAPRGPTAAGRSADGAGFRCAGA